MIGSKRLAATLAETDRERSDGLKLAATGVVCMAPRSGRWWWLGRLKPALGPRRWLGGLVSDRAWCIATLGSTEPKCPAIPWFSCLLALHVRPANVDDGAEIGRLAYAIQEATGESVTLAYVDQDYTGEAPAEAANERRITLEVQTSLRAA